MTKCTNCGDDFIPDEGVCDEITVSGIRSAGMTQMPSILSEAVEAAMKAGCFKDNDNLVKFVQRRVKEIEAGLGDGDLELEIHNEPQ